MFIFHSFGFTSKVILSLFFPDASFENCTLEPLYTAAPISICCKFDNSLCCLYFLFPVFFFFFSFQKFLCHSQVDSGLRHFWWIKVHMAFGVVFYIFLNFNYFPLRNYKLS